MSFQKIITLPNGDKMPQIGFGTWQSFDGVAANNVEVAVRNGYRHLDLAHVYENQVEIGETLKKVIPSVVKREELFITGKLWNSSHKAADVEKELDLTLQELGLDYLDLYCMLFNFGYLVHSLIACSDSLASSIRVWSRSIPRRPPRRRHPGDRY